ncbi:MAG: hypothetical protein WCB53_00395 [Terriglobales bacterium]
MAASPKSPLDSNSNPAHSHVYHAQAHVLMGQIDHPIKQPLEHYGQVVLENSRRETHIAQEVAETSIEGLISFKSGHTRVIGTLVRDKKDIFGNDHAGHVTLATAVLEGFNVIDIVTADRVVAEVCTEHPLKQGKVPRVSFLGTRFENLRIAGYPVEVELDLNLCGDKPDDDRPYLTDKAFLGRLETQLKNTANTKGFPKGLAKQYEDKLAYINDLKGRSNGGAKGKRNGYSKVQCSLVKSIGPIPIPGVRTFGNHIFIPNFGTIALAELEVGISPAHGNGFSKSQASSSQEPTYSHYFTLNMFDMKLGCPVGGSGKGPGVTSNGTSGGPGSGG